MKKIAVAGLGLIGGSMAKAIVANTNCEVYALDQSKEVLQQAISEGIVSKEMNYSNLSECDMMIVALYPRDVVPFIRDYCSYLKKDSIVVDCTGIKGAICRELSQEMAQQGLFFIGGHPMAGKEVAGYGNSMAQMFVGASMILCKDSYTNPDAFAKAKEFFLKLGFAGVKETSAEEHDRVIAYTSQMAHVVSSAYIRSEVLSERYGFSAGSFKDMTRVAKLNEDMWTDLFLENREALLTQLDEFIQHTKEYRDAIEQKDTDRLRELLQAGRLCKELDEQRENELTL